MSMVLKKCVDAWPAEELTRNQRRAEKEWWKIMSQVSMNQVRKAEPGKLATRNRQPTPPNLVGGSVLQGPMAWKGKLGEVWD